MIKNVFLSLLYIIVIILTFGGCVGYQKIYKKDDRLSITNEDLTLLTIIEFLKFNNSQCSGGCYFKINSELKIFNNEILNCQKLKTMYQSAGYISIDNFKLKFGYFDIPQLGKLSFNTWEKKSDFSFSPILYFHDQKLIIGQVYDNDHNYTRFKCYLIGDRVIWSGQAGYTDCLGLD